MEHDICVIGLGKLGLPLAVSLALKGQDVLGVDRRKDLVDAISSGSRIGFVGIAGIEGETYKQLLGVVDSGNFSAANFDYAVQNSEYIFIIVNTPSGPDGSFSLEQVLPVCRDISLAITNSFVPKPTVIISSTVNPGDINRPITEALEFAGITRGKDFYLAHWPEFVALGNTLNDFLAPDYIVIGTDSVGATESVTRLLASLNYSSDTSIFPTSIANAEMIKIMLNFAVSNKIIMANYIGYLCEHIPGVDGAAVLKAIGMDSRIGSKYFSIGTPLGGPCFPRDIESAETIRKRWTGIYGINLNIGECNELYEDFLLEKIDVLREETQSDKIAIIGQAFKAGTDCKVSFGSVLERRFEECFVYDSVLYLCESLFRIMDGAGIIIVTRRYNVEKELPDFYSNLRRGQIVFDPWRTIDEKEVIGRGAKYETIGRHITLPSIKEATSFFSGKDCLVTGGTGMIGRQVCRLLAEQGARVFSVSLELPSVKERIDGVMYFHADLTDTKACNDYISGVDIVFHVAGINGNPKVTESQTDKFYAPMLQMNTNVIMSAIKYNIDRLVFVSSIGAYPAGHATYTEDITGYPMDLPGLAKLAAEEIIRAHIEKTGATWSIVRPTNVYGPGDNFDIETGMVIPSLIAKAEKTSDVEDHIDVWGNGKAVRDFIYVDDVARGILLAAEFGMYGNPLVNLGGKEALSIDDVVLAICKEFDIRWKYTYEGSGGFPRRVLDHSLAKKIWGWKPTVGLEEGIRKTIEWYITNGQEKDRFNPLREAGSE